MPSPHPYAYEQMREPVYRDEYEDPRLRYPPPPQQPQPERQRTQRRREYEPEESHRRRRKPPHEMRPPSSLSDSESPSPPRRYQSRREPPRPRDHEAYAYDSYDDRHIPSRRHPERRRRDDGYVSDNRYNRPRHDMYEGGYEYLPRRERPRDPRDERDRMLRDPRDERDRMPRDRRHDDRYRDAPRSRPKPARSGSRWQKEAKNMFVEYAVPVIKAEGGKYLSKQIGNFIAKK